MEDIDQALLAYRSSLETRFSEIINSSSKIGPQIVEEIVKEARQLLLIRADVYSVYVDILDEQLNQATGIPLEKKNSQRDHRLNCCFNRLHYHHFRL